MDVRSHLGVVFRRLRKTPVFTVTVVLTLGICFAANLTLFALVDSTLLRPLPFPAADRLVAIINSYPNAGYPHGGSSVVNYFERRRSVPALASVSLYREQHVVVGEDGSPERVPVLEVSSEFLATLDVSLARGRDFSEADMKQGSEGVAIITDEFWHHSFQGAADIIGRRFQADGTAVTIVGVLRPNFTLPGSETRLLRPLVYGPSEIDVRNRHNSAGQMIARLAPGATIAQAQQQLAAVDARAAGTDPSAPLLATWGYHTIVRSFAADLVRDIKPSLVLLQFGAVFLFAIGIANLMNLALIRANVRTSELAVRFALGAGLRHVVVDALAESTVITAGGAAIGVVLARWGLQFVNAYGAKFLPLGVHAQFDRTAFILGVGVVATVLLLLALPVVSVALRQSAQTGARASRAVTTSRTAQRVRNGFVVIQVALSFVLLCGAAVLGITLKHLLAQPLGFRPDYVLTGQVTLPRTRYPNTAARRAFVARLLSEVLAQPGVRSVAVNNGMPFTGAVGGGPVSIAGEAARAGGRAHHRVGVTSGFADVMGLRVLTGRFLEPADDAADRNVCVIDQAMADTYWPRQSALGRQLAFGTEFKAEKAATVVGVVDNVKQNDLAERGDFGTVYFPYDKFDTNFFYVAIRTEVEPAALASALRHVVLRIDPELPVDDIRVLSERVSATLVRRETPAVLAAGFSLVALAVATIGLYGVLAYAVTLREKEFGIRMAIGARRAQIVQMIWANGARLIVIGIMLGALIALATGRFVQALLFETTSGDPMILTGIAALLLAVGSAACLIPARRASQVDPSAALRAE